MIRAVNELYILACVMIIDRKQTYPFLPFANQKEKQSHSFRCLERFQNVHNHVLRILRNRTKQIENQKASVGKEKKKKEKATISFTEDIRKKTKRMKHSHSYPKREAETGNGKRKRQRSREARAFEAFGE